MIEDILQETIDKFNKKTETDQKLRAELEGLVRNILIKLDDGRSYHFTLKGGKASVLSEGTIDSPDITMESSEEVLTALYHRQMRVMKAFALRKIRVDASLEDMVRFRSFF